MFGTLDNHPAEYAVKTLRDLSECYAGATPSTKVKEYWDNGSIPWMSSGEVHMEHVTETESKITESGYQQTSTKMVPVHSVVIALAGQGKTRGKVAITEIPLCTNQSLCAIVPSKDIHYEYLYHNLKGRYLELRGMAGDVNGRGGLNLKIVQSIQVIVPPIDEQMKFVAIAQQADKSKFSCLKSQFIEMLSNSGYEEKSLGELCDKITDGSHNPPKGNDGSEYLMISSKNVFIDGLDLADVRYLSKEEFDLENKRTEVKKNNILLTIVGTIGRTYLVKGNEGNIVMQRSVAVLKPSDRVNPLFMMYSLHIDENLEKEGRGNAQKGVYLKQLSQFKIKVPSLDVQNNFCTIYQQADKSKQIAFSRAS